MKTIRFHYVRHGQTLFNKLGRMQGWCDSPLTEEGIRDAEKAREILKDVPLRAAFVSTSERCRDTLAIILEGRDIPVREMKGLKEINFGIFEAERMEEGAEELFERRRQFRWRDVGGDDYESFSERMIRTYQQIYDMCEDGDTVLVVSHGAAFIWMQKILLNIDREKLFAIRMERGIGGVPNGYVGLVECRDGRYELKEMAGMTADEIRSCRLPQRPGSYDTEEEKR